MAKNELCEREVTGKVCTFTFINGVTLVCDGGTLSEDTQAFLIGQGLRHCVGDAFSGAKGSVDAAIAMAEGKWEAFQRGDLRTKGESTGGIVAEALARILKKPQADVRNALKAMEAKERRKLENDPRVLAAIADIRAERAEKAEPTLDLTAALNLSAE